VAVVVIVHGACGGGWEWSGVARRLRPLGHEVFTPTLTGLGERAHLLSPDIGLETHIADVVNVLELEDLRDVVLAGHSYGGMVVVGAADRVPERIARLVVVDGFLPMPGQSSQDLTEPEFFEAMVTPARERGDGWRVPAWDDEDELEPWYRDRLRDHPLKTLTDPIRLEGGPPSLPGTYIRCEHPERDPRSFASSRDAAIALGWDVRSIEALHDIAMSDPALIASLLDEVATSTARRPV
jgi:pimeloyl-ACP methyl ester carboxylesterase